MVDQIAVVTFTTPASTGTFPVTHPSITETFNCAILIYSATTTDDSNVSHGSMGIGFVSTEAGGSADFDSSSGCFHQDNRNTVTQSFHEESGGGTAECIRAATAPGVSGIVAEFSAAIAGGVELNFTTTTVQAKCTAILFAGASRSCIGGCTFVDGVTAHEDVGNSTPGFFQPDLIVFLSSNNALDGGANNGQPKIGFAINPASGLQQISAYTDVDQGSDPTAADGYYNSDAAASGFIGEVRTAMDRIQITSFDSTGFNATAATTAGINSPQANYLAIKWNNASLVRMALGHLPVAASTGNQTYNTFGFTPGLLFGLSHLMTTPDAIDGTEANVCSAGYFVTGQYGSRAVSVHHDHGHTIAVGTESDANTQQGDHAVLTLTGLGAIAHKASWVGGSGSGGFVLNFSTAAQAGTLTALGIQLIPNTPFRTRWPDRLATRRNRKPAKRALGWMGKASVEGLPRFWRAIQRFRRAMAQRLLRRPLPPAEPVDTTPSATGQEAEGAIFSAGAKRAEVVSGGAVEGSVF